MAKSNETEERLDRAARAAWLYYVAENSQDDIARKFGISRQVVQRLISMAVSERLIKFRLDRPIARCMELAVELSEKFNLKVCEIVPTDPDAPDLNVGMGIAGAAEMQKYLRSEAPKVIAIGTGLAPRACVEQLPPMDCPQHKIVSLVGNMHTDGSATAINVVEKLAERVGAPHYPMPLPVLVRNPSDLLNLHEQDHVAQTRKLCSSADVAFVGIAHIDKTSPLVRDGFITNDESRALVKLGGVGEIVGWVFDINGKLVPGVTNDRVSSAPLMRGSDHSVVGLAIGQEKAKAILGALCGQFVNGLVTDEVTAQAILDLTE